MNLSAGGVEIEVHASGHRHLGFELDLVVPIFPETKEALIFFAAGDEVDAIAVLLGGDLKMAEEFVGLGFAVGFKRLHEAKFDLVGIGDGDFDTS